MASQWRMMWIRFKQHRLAVWSGLLLGAVYFSVLISEFIAPYNMHSRHTNHIYAPPQQVRFFTKASWPDRSPTGSTTVSTWKTSSAIHREPRPRGPPAFLLSRRQLPLLGPGRDALSLVCPPKDGTFFLLGTDRLGRDVFSRIVMGTRISLTVGLIGITISFLLGMLFGGLAGYYGGWVDNLTQRAIEVIRSFPELPLWMALSAALPVNWSPILIYFGITVILGLLDWTGLARAVRSKLLAVREEDFVSAARLMGAQPGRIIWRHMMPSFMSHLIASATLSVPSMILGETALSFLGLGLRPPITSWGVLLAEAQNINVVALYPWLMLPVVPVVVVILAFNFFGDGLRDAADPYK